MTPAKLARVAHAHPEYAPESVSQLTLDIQTNQPLFTASGYISPAAWRAGLNVEKFVIHDISVSDPRYSWKQLVDMSFYNQAVKP